jgi:hypothetical protein
MALSVAMANVAGKLPRLNLFVMGKRYTLVKQPDKHGSNIILHIGSTRTGATAEMNKPPKRPRDLNQWAKRTVEIATAVLASKSFSDDLPLLQRGRLR